MNWAQHPPTPSTGFTERGKTKAQEFSCCSEAAEDLDALHRGWEGERRLTALSMREMLTTVRKSKITPDECRTANSGLNTDQKPAQCRFREVLIHTQ